MQENQLIQLINIISDGRFYDDDQLEKALGISRAEVSSLIEKLGDFGLVVDCIKGKGYRLRAQIELLDSDYVLAYLKKVIPNKVELFELELVSKSTNATAIDANIDSMFGVICSEYQSCGKGRRGREWSQGLGSGLLFSLVKDIEVDLKKLSSLSLWVAIMICDVLQSHYSNKFKVKWPNDIYVDDKKLAGILLEAKVVMGGKVRLVVGVGINMVHQHICSSNIEQPWTSLSRLSISSPISRNDLFARLLSHLIVQLESVVATGIDTDGCDLASRWEKYDYLTGREICLSSFSNAIEGVYRGIDKQGNILVEVGSMVSSYNAGEVSVKKIGV